MVVIFLVTGLGASALRNFRSLAWLIRRKSRDSFSIPPFNYPGRFFNDRYDCSILQNISDNLVESFALFSMMSLAILINLVNRLQAVSR